MSNRFFIVLVLFFTAITDLGAQGLNSNWLLCYGYPTNLKAKFVFTDTSALVLNDNRKIPFIVDTQGNISDKDGNILMSSNGVFIANATGDTMLNGGGLNPNSFTSSWPDGLPLIHGNIFLPMPEDSNRYMLIHQTGDNNALFNASTKLYYSIIDITGDAGLGEVVIKNQIFFQDTLNYGLAACKHANGRDWWITANDADTDKLFVFLLDPTGIIFHSMQSLNVVPRFGGGGAYRFSPDGSKFAFTNWTDSVIFPPQQIELFDFDRCTGVFSNGVTTTIPDTILGFGVQFSPNSRFLYASSFQRLYQIDTYATNIPASLQLIAVNDTFPSPAPPFFTDFWSLYLAANGKIYITSGGGVVDLHYINYPDSAGTASDVHLHDILLPCFTTSTVPNHPNYYLGPVQGSVCDSLTTSINDLEHHFNFSVAPNPSTGTFKIMYLLPQNKNGTLRVYDLTGREVYSMYLPPWSTLQSLSLSHLPSGLYHTSISSDVYKVSKKLVLMK